MSEQNKRTTNQGIPPTGTPARTGAVSRSGGAPTPPTGFRSAGSGQRRDDRRPRRPFEREQKEFEEKMISINRVSKTTKGGRMLRFAALVVIGDKKGRVGFGTGKAAEVPDAMKKAIKNARKSVYRMKINKKGTIHHQVTGRHGASSVLLKPAPDGTGIVAGGAIRAVIELAGYTNVYTKNLGAKSPLNMVRATVHGLQQLRTPAEIAKLRDKELSQL